MLVKFSLIPNNVHVYIISSVRLKCNCTGNNYCKINTEATLQASLSDKGGLDRVGKTTDTGPDFKVLP